MISLAKKQWLLLNDPSQFQQFLEKSHDSFEAKKIRIPPNQTMDQQNSKEFKKREKIGREYSSYSLNGERGTLQKLVEYINHFNQTVSQLPELIQDIIEKTIESKMEEELKRLKIELKNYLASELESNYSSDSLEGKTDLALNKQITKDQSSAITIVEEVESQKEKFTTKSHIKQNNLSEITLKDALKILRDED